MTNARGIPVASALGLLVSGIFLAGCLPREIVCRCECRGPDRPRGPEPGGKDAPGGQNVEEAPVLTEKDCRKEKVFRDEQLEILVRKALGKLDGPITAADLAGVIRLSNQRGEGSAAGISDLTGLRCLSSLESLVLVGSDLVDIRELSYLRKLKALDLSGNRISDASPLGELADLKDLRLDRNRIEDLGFLPGLGRLERLSLEYNEISDLGPFARVASKLFHVSLRHNRIRDLSALTGIEGRHLVLYENDIRCQDSREDLTAISLRWDEIGVECEEFNTEP